MTVKRVVYPGYKRSHHENSDADIIESEGQERKNETIYFLHFKVF